MLTAFNYDRAENMGLELKSSYTNGNFRIYGNLAWAKQIATSIVSNQFLFAPDELAFIANHYIYTDHAQTLTASAGASYLWNGTRLSASMIYGSGNRAGFANTDHVPSYTQVNLGISHEYLFPGWSKPTTLRFDVVNLFDQIYENQGWVRHRCIRAAVRAAAGLLRRHFPETMTRTPLNLIRGRRMNTSTLRTNIAEWLTQALVGVVLLAACTNPATAHPHVWVTAASELIYAPNGSVTAIRHAWTFDDMFSTYALQGTKSKKKGVYTREELAPLAQTNLESLREYGFFTFAKVEGQKQLFLTPTDYFLEYRDSALVLHFTLTFKTPIKSKQLVVEIFDPSYFVDFALQRQEPTRLHGAPASCTAAIQRPSDGTAGAQKLGEASFLNGSNSNYGAMFANRITVDSPEGQTHEELPGTLHQLASQSSPSP